MQKAVIFERTRAMLREVFYSQTVFFLLNCVFVCWFWFWMLLKRLVKNEWGTMNQILFSSVVEIGCLSSFIAVLKGQPNDFLAFVSFFSFPIGGVLL